jgi:hypothetical protein
MKKFLSVPAILLLLLTACNFVGKPPDEESIISTTTSTTTSAALPTPIPIRVDLPVYKPADIKPFSSEELSSYADDSYDPDYRGVYYTVPDEIWELTDPEREEAFNIYREDCQNEMWLVSVVKYFDIPENDFVNALKKTPERVIRQEVQYGGKKAEDIDFSRELYELPNPDIIYTFDNEIINAYYRLKDPVVPDWLTSSPE